MLLRGTLGFAYLASNFRLDMNKRNEARKIKYVKIREDYFPRIFHPLVAKQRPSNEGRKKDM